MKRLIIVLLPLLFLVVSCKKFLDHKPTDEKTIESLNDLQLMLNYTDEMNSRSPSGLAELISDNYYMLESDYHMFSSIKTRPMQSAIQNYTWEYEALASEYYWEAAYQHSILVANNVLYELTRLDVGPEKKDSAAFIEGQALFYRAFTFLNLAQLFCRPWSDSNKDSMGIVLRLSPSVNSNSNRYTLGRTYETIKDDLLRAVDRLPEMPAIATQPSKLAAYAALARTYLMMNDALNAGIYADKVLQRYHQLMDYNNMDVPIKRLNPEVIFHSSSSVATIMNRNVHRIDSVLYNLYDENDLRKSIFFQSYPNNPATYYFEGSYNSDESPHSIFDGLATDEMYLIRAESAARQGKLNDAVADLDALLVKRWKQGTYTPFASTSKDEIISKIILERRKELVWRGLRWPDIRRLNVMGANIMLKRKVGNEIDSLLPNSLNTILLLPDSEVKLGGVTQNYR